MKVSVVLFLLLVLAVPIAMQGQTAMPRMTTVEPATCKVGDLLTVAGENLNKASVAEVFLTDGQNDFKVAIEEQADKAIKFKVPEKVKTGRLALMLLTAGKEPKLIEQPVKVTIE